MNRAIEKFLGLDWGKWGHNALLFLAALFALYLLFVRANLEDGFQKTDFIPTQEVMGAMMLYIINTALDLTKKFIKAR